MKTPVLLLIAIIWSGACAAQATDSTAAKPEAQLRDIKVVSRRPVIRQEADKLIYDLQADPQSKAGSLLDMMRKVPHIAVDANEHILLKGSSAYKVFINGRPSGLLQGDPADVLRSIPASTVKSIEVITPPPPKYDAEGLAGIINIVMLRQVRDGYKGAVNLSEKTPVGGPGAGGSFTARMRRLDVSVLAGFSSYKTPETAGRLSRAVSGASPDVLSQEIITRSGSRTAYAGTELNYEPDSLNLVSAGLDWKHTSSSGFAAQTAAATGRSMQRSYKLHTDHEDRDAGLDANVSYQRGFKHHKDRLLTFSYRYSHYYTSLYSNAGITDELNCSLPDYRQYNRTSAAVHTGQADHVHPLGKLMIESGIKGVFRTNESGFAYCSLNGAGNTYEPDPARSNTLLYRQKVLAVYHSYDYTSGEWQLKAGVRAEQTIIDIGYRQDIPSVRNQYLNVLPTLLVSRRQNDRNSLSFSFTERIQRPSATELNPFVNRTNPDVQSAGNPYLLPITSYVCQLSYLHTAKTTWNAGLGGMFFHNVFNAVQSYDTAAGATVARYENYGKGRVFKFNFSLNGTITKNWTCAINSDIRYVLVDGRSNNGSAIKNSGVSAYVYISSGYSLKGGWRASGDLTCNTGGILLPMGRTNGSVASSFTVSRSMVQSRLTASVGISNPFTRFRYATETTYGPDFEQTSRQQYYYRRLAVSLNYQFGALKEAARKSRRGIDGE